VSTERYNENQTSIYNICISATPTDLSVPPYFSFIYISYYLLTNMLTALNATGNIY